MGLPATRINVTLLDYESPMDQIHDTHDPSRGGTRCASSYRAFAPQFLAVNLAVESGGGLETTLLLWALGGSNTRPRRCQRRALTS